MTPGPEGDIPQSEKRAVMRQDADLRRQQQEAERQRVLREGTTFHQFAQSQANDEAGGRFAAVNATTVVGAQPLPTYPAASSSWQIQLPDEPPLRFENPALDESSAASILSVEQTGDPVSDAPHRDKPAPAGSSESERAGSFSIKPTEES